jgi:Na+-translocating ferredoxin:NAD+ oxidoreductase RnfG subunit
MLRFFPLLLALLAASGSGLAEVFYSKEEAFELAFGKDAQIEHLSLFLTDEQVAAIEKMSQAKLDSQLFTFYEGKKNSQTLGYAAIESHTVRTQPETLLIVLSPKGELVKAEILAFHEPPEYKPAAAWLERLYRRPVGDLRLNQNVDAISGATLSSRASLDGIRKTLAVYNVAVAGGAR